MSVQLDGGRPWWEREVGAYNPDQPRHPKGVTEGGRWRPAGASEPIQVSPKEHGLVEAIRRGTFEFQVTSEGQDPYGGTAYKLAVGHHVPESWKSTEGVKDSEGNDLFFAPRFYDPEVATLDPDARPVFKLKPGYADQLSEIAKAEPGFLFRGMSQEEWQEAQRTGEIKSRGGYNLSSQAGLTYYSTDPDQASSYAHGFAPWQFQAAPGHPAIVIKVRDPGTAVDIPGVSPEERGIPGVIPIDDVVGVYRGHVYVTKPGTIELRPSRVVGDPTHTVGSTGAPTSDVAWTDASEDELGGRKRKASAPWWEREVAYNPHHVKSGEHGGEFTSAEGAGEGEAEPVPPAERNWRDLEGPTKVGNITAHATESMKYELEDRGLTPESAIRLTGLQALADDPTVEIDTNFDRERIVSPDTNEIENTVLVASTFKGKNPDGSEWQGKQIRRLESGRLYNSEFFLSDNAPEGVGLKVLAAQVAEARTRYDRIDATAAGEKGDKYFNGYYTWPRMGFDASVGYQGDLGRALDETPLAWRQAHGLADAEGNSVSRFSLLDLMSTKEGRDLWREYGGERKVSFDLRDGSPSREALSRYLDERGFKNPFRAWRGLERYLAATSRPRAEEGLELSAEDEATLDRIWGSPEMQALLERTRAERLERLEALEGKGKASRPWWERSLAFNPHHVKSGEHGGEFTSAEGAGEAEGEAEEKAEDGTSWADVQDLKPKDAGNAWSDPERLESWEEYDAAVEHALEERGLAYTQKHPDETADEMDERVARREWRSRNESRPTEEEQDRFGRASEWEPNESEYGNPVYDPEALQLWQDYDEQFRNDSRPEEGESNEDWDDRWARTQARAQNDASFGADAKAAKEAAEQEPDIAEAYEKPSREVNPIALQEGSSKINVSADTDTVARMEEMGLTRDRVLDLTGLRVLEGHGDIDIQTTIVRDEYAGEKVLKVVSDIEGTGPDGRTWTGKQTRFIRPDSIANHYFKLDDDAPTGLGLRIFAAQVDAAKGGDFDHLDVFAAGNYRDSEYNGYYTWPRFGFDGEYVVEPGSGLDRALRREPVEWQREQGFLAPDGRWRGDEIRLSDLMSTERGREIWKRHGDSAELQFDLEDGSISRTVLNEYLRERGFPTVAAFRWLAEALGLKGAGEEIELTAEDEAILSRVWASSKVQDLVRKARERRGVEVRGRGARPWWEREVGFNPYHVKTGAEHGGEFTSKEGAGEGGALLEVRTGLDEDSPDLPPIDEGAGSSLVKIQLRDAKLPPSHTANLVGIGFREGGLAFRKSTGEIIEAYGVYYTERRRIELSLNAPGGSNIHVFGGGTVLHEIGHHVHLARLTDQAADEWAAYSENGLQARISAYARTNRGEHFAEAYRAYARGGSDRAKLKALEPKAYAFMRSLWRLKSPRFIGLNDMPSLEEMDRRYRDEPGTGASAASRPWWEREVAYNPDQPRWEKGKPTGGQWRPAKGGDIPSPEPSEPAPSPLTFEQIRKLTEAGVSAEDIEKLAGQYGMGEEETALAMEQLGAKAKEEAKKKRKTLEERLEAAKTPQAQLKMAKIPASHLDGAEDIRRVSWEDRAALMVGQEKLSPEERYVPQGLYTWDREILMQDNSYTLTNVVVFHELGHHVHLARLTDDAAREWAAYSQDGATAKISAYARTNRTEHFAEVYREYAKGGASRAKLKALEPEAWAFMRSIWREGSPKLLPREFYVNKAVRISRASVKEEEWARKNYPQGFASRPWWEREVAFNPHHVKSGEHGGEFTSAEGGEEPGGGGAGQARWEKTTPEKFIKLRNRTTRPGFLSPLEPADLADHQLFTAHGGTVGFALDPQGDMQNLFNNGGPKGSGVDGMVEAIDRGGRTGDAFDGFLPGLYAQLGLEETGRVKFNDDYAPKGWDFDRDDRPDVVFMAWQGWPDGDRAAAISRAKSRKNWRPAKKTQRYFDDWDQAKDDSRGFGPRGTREGAAMGRETQAPPPPPPEADGYTPGETQILELVAATHGWPWTLQHAYRILVEARNVYGDDLES